ncbi:hypothetical protein JEP40_05045 [Proteus vulgaris]|uniref:hypothetical protein n=1 Tax=Proteus vulgaris TaxID=585 RepID=UPI0018E4114A|nr:hypothetical protein [Proteus vulgaris]MBI6528502.1 hypothetical protein [Proteus vulgaris]
MISWKIPSLTPPPAPKPPRFIRWLFIMIIMGAIGFALGLYLSISEILSPTINNTMLIVVFALCPTLLTGLIRLFIYSFASYRHQLFTDILDDARQKWRHWAGKHLGLLTHARLTHIDEERKEDGPLSSLTPNKGNILKLEQLTSCSLWEKQERVVQKLLTPIAEYYHQYNLTVPLTLYWQVEEQKTDWQALIQQEAVHLSLPLDTVEMLPYASFNEWLLALYENSFEPKVYAILTFQLDPTASEEATSLLLAPQGLYEQLKSPIKAKLLRPIATERDTFADALKTQCEFQLSGPQLTALWHSNMNESNKGECIPHYVQQNMRCLSEHFYDSNIFLGIGGLARHSVTLTLASDALMPALIIHQNGNKLLLQQVII